MDFLKVKKILQHACMYTEQIKTANYIKVQHTSTFISAMDYGKNHFVLDQIEKEYNKDFDYIIIIC